MEIQCSLLVKKKTENAWLGLQYLSEAASND